MKEVILLVGPMGSGKSTYVKEFMSKYVYISQDEQGQTKHLELFKDALKGSDSIVVDRINHTREQRYRYTSLAKDAGFITKIVEFYEPYHVCFDRIKMRKDHPTLKSHDETTIIKALDMYFTQYEQIGDSEADFMLRSGSNPKVLDLTNEFNKARRTFVVGDLHGCYDELITFLNKLGYLSGIDLLLSCGDLVDRGPKIFECLESFVKYTKRHAVRGNHDDKYIRYMRGNKVNKTSIQKTIEQCEEQRELGLKYVDVMSALTHTIIKFGNNYITHAGFNPNKHPEHTTREFSLYARKYDETMQTFTNNSEAPFWYEVPRKYPMYNLFFGHEVHVDKCEVAKGIYAMDAGCVFGNKLRIAIVTPQNGVESIEEMDSFQPKTEQDKDWDFINKFEPYEKLVEAKYLNKQENGDLVLYNYTDKCTYDKNWNKYTMECRGLILNKITGETVARPFSKFFNLGELESPALPNVPVGEKYEVYEKVDGSLGILYLDPADNQYKIATRGSFKSDQAIKATQIFNNVPEYEVASYNERYVSLLDVYPKFKDYTLLFEIIYPENRMNDGARLVCDYGSKETLILLGGVNKVTGKDLSYEALQNISMYIGLPLTKRYDYTIDDLIKLKSTLPMTEEGWVIRFESGFRIKIKGDEYCKMQKILNSVTPLHIWGLMCESDLYSARFEVPYTYKMQIPEEVLAEVDEIEQKLKDLSYRVRDELSNEYKMALEHATYNFPDHVEKGLGLYATNGNLKHKSAIFLQHKNNFTGVRKYINMIIRPRANQIGE